MELLGEGATVPFIARYRKERMAGLDDTQLRRLAERLGYLRELEERRATVLKSIEEQGKLTPDLKRAAKFVDGAKGIADAKAALDGARHILIERMAEESKLVGSLREWEWAEACSPRK